MIGIDLSGKTALVTGASGQLGRVMARRLAEAGAAVAVHWFSGRDAAERLVASLTEGGARCRGVQADVRSEESVNAMRDELARSGFLPDIVVDNAVVQYEWQSVLAQPVADYVGQFESCVLQNVLMAKAFVPHMIERKFGRFIGINTECTMQCREGQSAYVAGKRGMDGVLRVLAKEVGRFGVTVNQVAPGWTISERDRAAHTEVQPTDDAIPLRRRGTDEEVANAVLFLASDLASYITGAFVPVCGGNVMPTV